MKALGIIANIFIPGLGSLILGQVTAGIFQLLLYFIGWALYIFTLGFGFFIALPMIIGAWIWGLVTAIQFDAPLATVQTTSVNSEGVETTRPHSIGS